MEQTKRTIRDIQRFVMTATMWQNRVENSKQSHLKYAISRVLPGCQKVQRHCESEMVRINIENGQSDEKGNILLRENGDPIFSKAGLQARNQAHDTLFDEEHEIGTYFAKIVPGDLTPAQEDAFEGFVIAPIKDPMAKEP
jgi:hypothetical protein